MTKKHLKAKKLKNSKSYKEASSQISLVNKLQIEFKNIKKDIFENFIKSKITPKTPKSKKIKNKKVT